MVSLVAASGGDLERNDCSVCDDALLNRGSFHGRTLFVDLLECAPSGGSRGSVQVVRAKCEDHPKVQKVGDFSVKHTDILDGGRLAVERRSFKELGCEKHLR